MYSKTDVKRFEDTCNLALKFNPNAINPELLQVALKAVKSKIGEMQNLKSDRQVPVYLTRSEVAEMIKCCEKQVDRLKQQGKLAYSKCGRRILIPLDAVEKYVSSNIVTTSAEQPTENHKGEEA